jgi:hypothetical protein
LDVLRVLIIAREIVFRSTVLHIGKDALFPKSYPESIPISQGCESVIDCR